MAFVYLLQPTDMSALPTSGPVSYNPVSTNDGMTATYTRSTPYLGDDVRIGYYGSFTEITGFVVGTAVALSLDTADDTDELPNLFVDGISLSVDTGFDPLFTGGNALAVLALALAGNDKITGSNGDDTIFGFAGKDKIDGVGGNDVLDGKGGGDRLEGGPGGDNLFGGSGDDALFGEQGKDMLVGGSGDDLLVGGSKQDVLKGGVGSDRFDFNAISDSLPGTTHRDIILTFNRSESDKIDLRTIDANIRPGASGNQAFEYIGTHAFTGNANDAKDRGEVRIVDTGSHIRVLADNDGDKHADFEILVKNVAVLGQEDFLL